MKVIINFGKTVNENAEDYFFKSKKAKKKLTGLIEAMPLLEKKLFSVESKKIIEKKEFKKKRKRNWFEKFHWSYSRNGFLIVSGKDAKTNELIVKKHMNENDLYFHADIHGAPHTVLKASEKKIFSEEDKFDAAVLSAVYSKAWKEKIPALDVYSVLPEQVSKSAKSGESIGTGAFMIYGKRNWFKKTPLNFALGFNEIQLIAGSINSIKKNCKTWIELKQGDEKKGVSAKKILFYFKKKGIELELDEIFSLLPSGGVELIE
jgi:predicted ribosome quality control (RQC) complex YloA/Tae2 family protein